MIPVFSRSPRGLGVDRAGPKWTMEWMRRSGGSIERARASVADLSRQGHDIAEFARRLTDLLPSVVPHSAACVVTVDPATRLLTGSYKFGRLAGEHAADEQWAHIEYGCDDPTRMALIMQAELPAIATSHLPGGSRDSIRMRELVGPAGYDDELRTAARSDGLAWGMVTLFRDQADPPFQIDEVLEMAALSATVATGLRSGLMSRRATSIEGSSSGPAVLIVGPDSVPKQIGLGTEELLGALTDEAHRSPAVSVIQGLAAGARRFALGEASTLPRARLRSPSGRWLIAQAAPLADQDAPTGDVVITIDDARPPEIVPLLASALGLTAREREVTQLVLGGVDTKGIASALSMSSYTVQDHLKSIFEKADVRSRRELMARIFFDHHAPRLADDVSSSGWH